MAHEAEATPSADTTLGFGRSVKSRLSVGRSDVLVVNASEVIADKDLAAYLERLADQVILARIACRMSFRPADREQFTRALFSVELVSPSAPLDAQPIARLLAPDRLSSGRFTTKSGMTLGIQAGVPGAALKVGGSSTATAEIESFYVAAAGEGESDPEWRYRQTDTMKQLEGSYEMGLVAEMRRGTAAEARISANATVLAGRHHTDVTWTPEEHIARITLPSG